MINKNVTQIRFNYPGNFIFRIIKFNATSALKGDYSRFCVLQNEYKEEHILSDNELLLRGFTGWKNRITSMSGGSTKKLSNKNKKNKKTNKRK